MQDIIVPIATFCFFGAVIIAPMWFHHRRQQMGLNLLEKALERGESLDPKLLDRFSRRQYSLRERARNWLNWGVMLSAVALGLASIQAFVGTVKVEAGGLNVDGPLPAAAFLICVAGGCFVLWAAHRRAPDDGAN